MSILVTGGLGYIGSHTVVELLDKNKEVIIVDDLSNSKYSVLDKIKKITGKVPKFYEINLTDENKLENVFIDNNITAVIHFAAFKSVGESILKPLKYYNNNIVGTIVLLKLINKYNIKKIVFSSSAAVYGDIDICPIKECSPLKPQNPYSKSKVIIENILNDMCKIDSNLNVVTLRYFNPIGAHKSGLIGEEIIGIPNNIMPYIIKVAKGELKELSIFGNNYNTLDGTGIRDYIHVVDLAKGHINALDILNKNKGLSIYNLGTGKGYSVLELIEVFEQINKVKIPFKFADRRPGDVGVCYADCTKANLELDWISRLTIEDMCKDAWHWSINN